MTAITPAAWLKQQSKLARPAIRSAIVFGVLASILIILQAHVLSLLIYHGIYHHEPLMGLGKLFAGLLVIVLCRALLVGLREYRCFRAGAIVRTEVRTWLFRVFAAQGPVAARRHQTGRLATVLMEQVEALAGYFTHFLPQSIIAVCVPLVILGYVLPRNYLCALILLFTAPLVPLFMILVGKGAAKVSQKHFHTRAKMGAHFLDMIQGLTTLKCFNRAEHTCQEIESVSEKLREKTMAVLKVAFLSSGVLEFFSSISIAMLAVYIGFSFLGHIQFGTYHAPLSFTDGLFILLVAPEFYLPLRDLGMHYHARANAVGAAENILMYAQPDAQVIGMDDTEKWVPAETVSLVFDRVSFAYPDRARSAIQDFSATVEAGQHIGVVGHSGAGKTSLLNLLLGFITPQSGQILFNDVPVRPEEIERYRANMAWVSQTPRLFFGTIRENICLGGAEPTDAMLAEAIEFARLTAFIDRLPQGLETPIGENSAGISGGQAQRIALARAYLKDAPLLLLDEPTANLDKQCAADIWEMLATLCQGKTVICLTHALRSLEKMDEIWVMDQGKLIQRGSFAMLREAPGFFQRNMRTFHDA